MQYRLKQESLLRNKLIPLLTFADYVIIKRLLHSYCCSQTWHTCCNVSVHANLKYFQFCELVTHLCNHKAKPETPLGTCQHMLQFENLKVSHNLLVANVRVSCFRFRSLTTEQPESLCLKRSMKKAAIQNTLL